MDKHTAAEDMKPCPFCGTQLHRMEGIRVDVYWRHPHPTECALSGFTVTPSWAPRWNRRVALTPVHTVGGVVELPNGVKVQVGGMFKLVYQQEFLQVAGPVKGHTGSDRRAAQLIREAWNKLPDFPSIGGGDDSSPAGEPVASDAWMTSALPDIIEEAVDRLSRGFIYSLTPEGREYWWPIHRRLEDMAAQKRAAMKQEGASEVEDRGVAPSYARANTLSVPGERVSRGSAAAAAPRPHYTRSLLQ